MKKLCFFLVLILFSITFFIPFDLQKAGAINFDEEIRLENIRLENFKKIREKAIEAEKEQSYQIAGLSDELALIEKNLVQLGRDKQLLEQELRVAKLEYTYSLNLIELLTKSIEDKERKMEKLVYILYKNYTLNYVAYLFSSKSINEILDKTIYLQYLFQAHKSYFGNLKEELKERDNENEKKVEKQERFYQMKSEVEVKMKEYDSQEKLKNQQINIVAQNKQYAIQQQQEAEQEMDRSNSKIKELLKKQQEEERRNKFGNAPFGKIQWPIAGGKMSSGFGNRLHPIFGYYRMHTGIDIDADSGTPIHTCAAGIVVYTGWLSGYGNVVIIQHNKTFSSVYAHQRVYYVREEQKVNIGDVIGEVGSTGWSTGPHLHFEIRSDGEPVNPMNYLP